MTRKVVSPPPCLFVRNAIELVLLALVSAGCFFTGPSVCWATDVSDPETVVIEEIRVEGADWTEEFVVTRELLFSVGDEVKLSAVEESVQRLRNMGLFRSAEYKLLPVEGGDESAADLRRVFVLELDERWTLLPRFGFNLGGGILSYSASVSDVNFLGRYVEVGALYYRFGETHSGVAWFYDPRFLNARLFAGGEVRWTNRVRVFYDDNGEVTGGYLRTRRGGAVALHREFSKRWSAGVDLAISQDSFDYRYLSDSIIAAQNAEGGLPNATLALPVTVRAALGRVDANSFLRDGQTLALSLSHSDPVWGSTDRFSTAALTGRFFRTLPLKSTLGLKFMVATTTAEKRDRAIFLGGLGGVRGLADSRYFGKHVWLANAELRIPSLDMRWLALQHVIFLDAAGIDKRPSQFWSLRAASSGLGLRVISPKIHGMVARIDYAFSMVGDGPYALSFGAGQYF